MPAAEAMAFDMKALAKMGVNVETFGDVNAFGDPSWYQAFVLVLLLLLVFFSV